MPKRKIAQGGAFLIHDVDCEDVFTPEQFSAEHKLVYKAAIEFVTKELIPQAAQIEAKDPASVRRWMRTCGELGLNAADLPEEFGGEGLDKISACLITEAMGNAPSFDVSHSCQTGIGTLPIAYFGTDAQKRKYLPKLASGEWIGAYCLTEPGAGSDALNAQTTATLSEDGQFYLLNGEKIYITNGAWADVFTVFAKVDGEHFTGFICEKDFEGLTVGAEEDKMGIKGSSTTSVVFKNCKVPRENLLYEIGKGHHIAFNVLNIGRYKLGAGTLGGAKIALAEALDYAAQREQFGRKINQFGMIREKIARMTVQIYMMETLCYRLAGTIDDKLAALYEHGEPTGAQLARVIAGYSIECAIAKVFSSEALDFVVDETVQIFGGAGYIAEYPAERMYRDSRINRIFEGTNEINRLVITGNLVKSAMAGKLDLMGALAAVQKQVPSEAEAKPDADDPLAPQEDQLTRCKQAFLLVTGRVADTLLATLQNEQEVVGLMADMIIRIYVLESGLLRARKQLQKKGAAKAELFVNAVKICFAEVFPETINRARGIIAYTDQAQKRHSAQLDRLAHVPVEDIITLKRTVAERTIKRKRYPF